MEARRQTLESKGFSIQIKLDQNRVPECKLNNVTHETEVEVEIDTQFIPKRGSSKYLKSIIQGSGEIGNGIAIALEWGE